MRFALMLSAASLVLAGCTCGLEPVRDCNWASCGEDLWLADGGSLEDTGVAKADAGSFSQPPVGAIDAGPTMKPPVTDDTWSWGDPYEACFPGGAAAPGDIISVHGRAGPLGTVNYSMRGYSAGASGKTGIQRFTNTADGVTGLPAKAVNGNWDTGLWVWNNPTPVVLGTEYTGTNLDTAFSQSPFIEFRISTDGPYIECPFRAGVGRFMFLKFGNVSPESPVEGVYEFSCPDAGVSVRGCFHYQ